MSLNSLLMDDDFPSNQTFNSAPSVGSALRVESRPASASSFNHLSMADLQDFLFDSPVKIQVPNEQGSHGSASSISPLDFLSPMGAPAASSMAPTPAQLASLNPFDDDELDFLSGSNDVPQSIGAYPIIGGATSTDLLSFDTPLVQLPTPTLVPVLETGGTAPDEAVRTPMSIEDAEWEDQEDADLTIPKVSLEPPYGGDLSSNPDALSVLSSSMLPKTASSSYAPDGDTAYVNFDIQNAERVIELHPGLYFCGLFRVEVAKEHLAFNIPTRTDVNASAVIDLVEQVLMPFGGNVIHGSHLDVMPSRPTNSAVLMRPDGTTDMPFHLQQQIREIRGATTDCWDTITAVVGTDVHRRRVVCLRAIPRSTSLLSSVGGVLSWIVGSSPSTTSTTAASDESTGNIGLQFETSVTTLVKNIVDALNSERLTAEFVGAPDFGRSTASPGSLSLIDSVHTTMTMGGHKSGVSSAVDSVVDPLFVRDLIGAYAQELRYNLEAVGVSLDEFVAKLEMQCARLMTTLKTMYQQCEIEVPTPPSKKPLSSFQLVMPPEQSYMVTSILGEEPNVNVAGLEFARLLILRARKAYLKSKSPGILSEDHRALAEMRFVLPHIFDQLRQAAEAEAQARVTRKTNAITARINDIENYRLELIRRLHQRYRFKSKEGNKMIATASMSSPDERAFKLFCSRFRITSRDEPAILDLPVCYLGVKKAGPSEETSGGFLTDWIPTSLNRWGHMYITHRHVFFHADPVVLSASAAGGMLLGLISRSAPVENAASDLIQLIFPINTVASCQAKGSTTGSGAVASSDSGVLELADVAGNVYSFSMQASSPPQYAARVSDLLKVLQACAKEGYGLDDASATVELPSGSTAASGSLQYNTRIVTAAKKGADSSDLKVAEHVARDLPGIFSSESRAFEEVVRLATDALGSASYQSRSAGSMSPSKSANPLDPNATADKAKMEEKFNETMRSIDAQVAPTKSAKVSPVVDASMGKVSLSHVSVPCNTPSLPTGAEAASPSTGTFPTPNPTLSIAAVPPPAVAAGASTASAPKPQTGALGRNIQNFLKQQQEKNRAQKENK